MSSMGRLVLLFIILSSCSAVAVRADQLKGEVVAIVSGDTVIILDAKNKLYRVGLESIQAPVSIAPYYQESLQHLAALALGKMVEVQNGRRLSDQRSFIGKVFTDGTDIALEQLRAGLAWSVVRDGPYAEAARLAQGQKSGMWRTQTPPTAESAGGGTRCSRIRGATSSVGISRPLTSNNRTVMNTQIPVERIVGDSRTKTFYRPGCAGYKKVSTENRVLFSSREEAIRSGYTENGC